MNTRKTLLIALFTGLIIVGTFLKIPLPPVPITLQTFFVILAGLLGGMTFGFLSTLLYLLLGLIGLPVFTSGGGLSALIGPTSGYLISMLFASAIAGFLSDRVKQEDNRVKHIVFCAIGGLIATLFIYGCGVTWLKISLSMDWTTALKVGVYPFIIGGIIKLSVALIITYSFKERFDTLIKKEIEE
ncbi:MAG: biotin transporter BioY [Spirochaetaceae bacterium]|nr:biotin transporter BioY [Spirochaetaceae bacterium]